MTQQELQTLIANLKEERNEILHKTFDKAERNELTDEEAELTTKVLREYAEFRKRLKELAQ